MKIKKLLLLFISLSLISSSSKAWDINSLFFSVKSFLVPFVNETVHNKNSFYITSAVACVASAYLINSYVKSYFEFVKKKKKEASVNARSKDDNTSLHDADKGYIEAIKALINQGADVNAQYEYGKTQLHRAAMYDCVQAIEALIDDKGANVNARDQDDKTPLHDAVMYDCVQPIKVLIDKGANVNAQDKYGNTPLRLAVQLNKVEFLKALIDADIDVKAQFFLLCCAIKEGKVEIVNALIDAGVNVNLQNEYGLTPLHIAVEYNNVEIVKALSDQGANVNAKYENALTPLNLAVQQNNVEIVQALIDAGVDVNAQSFLLYYPITYNNVEIVKALIDANVNVNFQGESGLTLLRRAVQHNNVEIVKALIDADIDVDAQCFLLCCAIEEGKVEIVKASIAAPIVFQNSKLKKFEKFELQQVKSLAKLAGDCLIEKLTEYDDESKKIILKAILKLGLNDQDNVAITYGKNPKIYNSLSKKKQNKFMQIVTANHLSIIQQMIEKKNNRGETALDVEPNEYSNEEECQNVIDYFKQIKETQKYDHLDEDLRKQIKDNYEKQLTSPVDLL